MTTNNIAYLKIDESYPSDNKPYYIDFILNQANPYDNIPDGCTLVAWSDITFTVKIGPVYFWNSVENAGVNSEGIPLYLIGDFYQK